jgi:hypothetical protein
MPFDRASGSPQITRKRKGAQMITYQGHWQVSVIGKDSNWDQRVVISGASIGTGTIPGVVGASQLVDGDSWTLNIEHNDGSGWAVNEGVLPDAMQEIGADMTQIVRSKDHYTPGDTDPNDLVVQVDKIGPMFALPVRPYAVDASTLLMLSDGVFIGIHGMQFMGVDVKNTWGEAFGDEVLFDISDLGRATLGSFGITVLDSWSASALQATQQTVVGRTIKIPPIGIGKTTTVYFQVDASNAHRGKPDVQFVLLNTGGTPDPLNPKRRNSRAIFIADLGYDRNTGTAIVRTPEGTASLALKSLALDPHVIYTLCRKVRQGVDNSRSGAGKPSITGDISRILAQAEKGYCDARTLRELLLILCRCLSECDCGKGDGGQDGSDFPKGGWQRACLPGGFWLPLKFDFTVEINGGFLGQFGPLAFQDPWWKLVLLIIALVALLVAIIEDIVQDLSGWGNTGDFDKKIGTVGASNRITTDAALIEFDGSRPAIQKVADVISGETNNNPILGLNTVIPIVPQIAFPSLAMADVVGKMVYKSGARTGVTHGIISGIGPFTQSRANNSTPDPNHPDLFLPDQFTIGTDPAFPEELFDDHGDSGSLVLSREADSMNQVVGLLHSGGGGTSPIQDVLAALALKLQ